MCTNVFQSFVLELCAAFQEQGFESSAASHQSLDAILGHLVTPGDIQLFQQWASLTECFQGQVGYGSAGSQVKVPEFRAELAEAGTRRIGDLGAAV